MVFPPAGPLSGAAAALGHNFLSLDPDGPVRHVVPFVRMSLLTGEPRTATVTAATDCDLVEIDAEGFRSVVLANPSVVERVTAVAAARREELDRHRETPAASASKIEIRQSLTRVRQFLHL